MLCVGSENTSSAPGGGPTVTTSTLHSSFLLCKVQTMTSTSRSCWVDWNGYRQLRHVTILWCVANILMLFNTGLKLSTGLQCWTSAWVHDMCLNELQVLRNVYGLKSNWISQESCFKRVEMIWVEERSASHSCQIIINYDLRRCQGQECFYKLFVKNGSCSARIYLLSRYTLCLIGPDKPRDNFPSTLQSRTRESTPYLQDYRFKLSHISCSNPDIGTI